jgi:hypothetical protein
VRRGEKDPMSFGEQGGQKEQRTMTDTTQAIREQAFLPLVSDIPEGLTLRQYRSERSRRRPRPRRRPRLRLALR